MLIELAAFAARPIPSGGDSSLGLRIVRAAGVRRGGQPVATLVLIGISVAVFCITHELTRVLQFTQGSLRLWALDGYGTFGPYVAELGEWWRIFTGTFLHADLRHLLFNMFILYLLGRRLEGFVGSQLLAGTYVASLIGGSAGALLHRPGVVVVGASGAVYGLMGAAYVVEHMSGGNPWRDGLGSLIIVNGIASFLVPGISIGGHLGGLAAGVVAGFALGGSGEPRRPATHSRRADGGSVRTRIGRSAFATWAMLAAIGAVGFVAAMLAATTWKDPLF